MWCFGLPTALIGFAAAILQRRDRDGERPMLIALICALLCTFFIRSNINRINMIWLPLIYFSALGCHVIFCALRAWCVLPIAAILLGCVFFVQDYADTFRQNVNYYPGLGSAIEYATAQEPECIYITLYLCAVLYADPAGGLCAERGVSGRFRCVSQGGAF